MPDLQPRLTSPRILVSHIFVYPHTCVCIDVQKFCVHSSNTLRYNRFHALNNIFYAQYQAILPAQSLSVTVD